MLAEERKGKLSPLTNSTAAASASARARSVAFRGRRAQDAPAAAAAAASPSANPQAMEEIAVLTGDEVRGTQQRLARLAVRLFLRSS